MASPSCESEPEILDLTMLKCFAGFDFLRLEHTMHLYTKIAMDGLVHSGMYHICIICVSMRVCIYPYKYIFIYIYIHTCHIYTYHTYIYTCIYIYIILTLRRPPRLAGEAELILAFVM